MKSLSAACSLIVILAFSGCVSSTQAPIEAPVTETGQISSPPAGQSGAIQSPAATQSYSGVVLAGKASPVIDFSPSDYQAALQSDKLVVLYFYANWCPICRAEVPQLYAAFEELNDERVVGFRVNFNDDQTDSSEIELARQFGVPYQHTKIFLRHGSQLTKSVESWSKARYLLEINKALSA